MQQDNNSGGAWQESRLNKGFKNVVINGQCPER
nr:MAG TPA: DIM protein [Caudoviricetes sp.]